MNFFISPYNIIKWLQVLLWFRVFLALTRLFLNFSLVLGDLRLIVYYIKIVFTFKKSLHMWLGKLKLLCT